jgi:hypothetical protein
MAEFLSVHDRGILKRLKIGCHNVSLFYLEREVSNKDATKRTHPEMQYEKNHVIDIYCVYLSYIYYRAE